MDEYEQEFIKSCNRCMNCKTIKRKIKNEFKNVKMRGECKSCFTAYSWVKENRKDIFIYDANKSKWIKNKMKKPYEDWWYLIELKDFKEKNT